MDMFCIWEQPQTTRKPTNRIKPYLSSDLPLWMATMKGAAILFCAFSNEPPVVQLLTCNCTGKYMSKDKS